MDRFFSSQTYFADAGLLLVRCLVGYIMVKYGFEIFNEATMGEYKAWLTDLNFPVPSLMAALGKIIELLGGISLILGLFTRLLAVPVMITMIIITFVMGDKEITSISFAYLLFYALFFFIGTGRLSLDYLLFDKTAVHRLEQDVAEGEYNHPKPNDYRP